MVSELARFVAKCLVNAVFTAYERAVGMVDARRLRHESEGDFVFRPTSFNPAPVPPGQQVRVGGSESKPVLASAAPIVCCQRYRSEVIDRVAGRVVYAVVQNVIIGDK